MKKIDESKLPSVYVVMADNFPLFVVSDDKEARSISSDMNEIDKSRVRGDKRLIRTHYWVHTAKSML